MGLFGKKKKETAPQPAAGDGAVTYNGNPSNVPVDAIDAALELTYNEYFAHLPFAVPGTPSGNAFAELLATAARDMERNRVMFTVATNYDDAVLNRLLADRTPENNRLYYACLFKTGAYGIIEENNVYSVDFIDKIPYCVALSLLLMAAKLPDNAHHIILEVEPDAPFYLLEQALALVKQCDPSFRYDKIIGA